MTRATTPSLEARSAQFGRQTLLPASSPETPARKAGVSRCLGLALETQSPSTVTSARLVRILELYDVKGHEIAPTTLSCVAIMPLRASSLGSDRKRSMTA